MPQHGIDMAGDARPVLGTDVAPATEVIGCGVVGRAVAGLDFVQDVDRRGDLGAGGQGKPNNRIRRPLFASPARKNV